MISATAMGVAKTARREAGLRFWMERVLEECDRTAMDFAADPVHDLRVALRRCRSMADGIRVIDPDKRWRSLKKLARPLFKALGELRDVQVMAENLEHLGSSNDPFIDGMMKYVAAQESALKQTAKQELDSFDKKHWRQLATDLPRRAARLRTGSIVFKHMALERWTEARRLQAPALRSASQDGLHNLRIALKRFRYIVENFLPELHDEWMKDLKSVQDVLGEIHDLDVLWAKALELQVFPDESSREKWREKVATERTARIDRYREKMTAEPILWVAWRAALPRKQEIQAAVVERIRLWSSFLDPNVGHSRHVVGLASRLLQGFVAAGMQLENSVKAEALLRAAAYAHAVGRSKKKKGYHKRSARRIRELVPPLGWTAQDIGVVAAVVRYHQGGLPSAKDRAFRLLSVDHQELVSQLAGILRIAHALDADRSGGVHSLEVKMEPGSVVILAEGYSARSAIGGVVAGARHLLEILLRKPVFVRGRPVKRSRGALRVVAKRRNYVSPALSA